MVQPTNIHGSPPAIDDSTVTAAIMSLLSRRDQVSSACPSEVARALMDGKDWRALIPQVLRVLQGLLHSRRVVVTRGTDVLTAQELEGQPIRFRRGARFNSP